MTRLSEEEVARMSPEEKAELVEMAKQLFGISSAPKPKNTQSGEHA